MELVERCNRPVCFGAAVGTTTLGIPAVGATALGVPATGLGVPVVLSRSQGPVDDDILV